MYNDHPCRSTIPTRCARICYLQQQTYTYPAEEYIVINTKLHQKGHQERVKSKWSVWLPQMHKLPFVLSYEIIKCAPKPLHSCTVSIRTNTICTICCSFMRNHLLGTGVLEFNLSTCEISCHYTPCYLFCSW